MPHWAVEPDDQVGLLDQSLREKTAVTEDQEQMVKCGGMAPQIGDRGSNRLAGPLHFAFLAHVAFEKVERTVGVRKLGPQRPPGGPKVARKAALAHPPDT